MTDAPDPAPDPRTPEPARGSEPAPGSEPARGSGRTRQTADTDTDTGTDTAAQGNGPKAAPRSEETVRATGLVKTHRGEGGAARAVRGVDLTVRRGEFVAITGPSGAGKSTLLHLVGGLQRPDAGSVWLDGECVDDYSEARWAVLRRRRIGIVFQFFNLVSNLTVADNVELPALLAGTSPRKARRESADLLEELGLGDRARSMPGELSGGEQQRVALARALVNHPALLLADEPAGSLDSRGTREVMRLLNRFHRRGQTILLVTHDARLASAADRVVSFFDGRVVDDADLAGDRTGVRPEDRTARTAAGRPGRRPTTDGDERPENNEHPDADESPDADERSDAGARPGREARTGRGGRGAGDGGGVSSLLELKE